MEGLLYSGFVGILAVAGSYATVKNNQKHIAEELEKLDQKFSAHDKQDQAIQRQLLTGQARLEERTALMQDDIQEMRKDIKTLISHEGKR